VDDDAWKNLDVPILCRVYLKHLVKQSVALTSQQLLECEFNNGLPFDWKAVQDKVMQILALGFSRNDALEALMVTGNKQVEAAAQYLLSDAESRRLERERAKQSQNKSVPPNRHYTIIESRRKEREEKEKWLKKSENDLMLEIQRLKMEIASQRSKREDLEVERNNIALDTKLALYEEYLRGLTAEPTINTAETEHLSRYRQQRKITEEEHKKILQKLGYDEKAFDKLKSFEDVTTNEDECVVCYEPPKDHMIIPCNHVCLCPDCANTSYSEPHEHQVCPLCNKIIQDVKQVYYF